MLYMKLGPWTPSQGGMDRLSMSLVEIMGLGMAIDIYGAIHMMIMDM